MPLPPNPTQPAVRVNAPTEIRATATESLNRRRLLKAVALAAAGVWPGHKSFSQNEQPNKRGTPAPRGSELNGKHNRRLSYNYDAWSPFYDGKSREIIHHNIDRFRGTQVTTILLSPNAGQSLTFPSAVGEMCLSKKINAEQRSHLYKNMGEEAARALDGIVELWRDQGIDPFGVLVDRSLAQGFETFVTFRMNDLHMVDMLDGQGPYTDAFYRQHPEWRIPGSWGLNFAIPEVRAHRLATLEEIVRRYPIHGLELDFLRRPPYFPMDPGLLESGVHETVSKKIPAVSPPGAAEASASSAFRESPDTVATAFPVYMAEESAPIMTDFVDQVRKMTQRISQEMGRKILLAVRVPSSLSGCRRVGLDPVAWHKRGCLDFLTVGHFLHLFYDLPIPDFRAALPGLTVYASLDFSLGGPRIDGYLYERDATAEIYRGASAALYSAGVDGIYLFNMFAPRGHGLDAKGQNRNHPEPLNVLREIGNPQTLEALPKLYLVDSRSHWLDKRFYDVKATLPQEVSPNNPLVVKLRTGERGITPKRMTLRVEAAQLSPRSVIRLQLNGFGQGKGKIGTQARLFKEEYDQLPPNPRNCVDFAVRSDDLKFGDNEVVVLASEPLTIINIELAVVPVGA